MRDAWRRFGSHRLALAAALLAAAFVVVALAAPLVAPYDPQAIGAAPLAPPSADHLLGTDQNARDVLSRLVYGTRSSLGVAVGAVAIALAAGGVLGLVAGYFGRWADTAVGRVTDVMFAVPDIVLALVLMAVLGPSLLNVAIAIGVVYTPIFARVCRGATLQVRRRDYVRAAEAVGASHLRVLTRHVLPNIAPAVIVQATLSLAFAILAEAALGFLGLSGEADAPSWGAMLRQGKDYMELAWWLAVFPGLAISLAVLSLNLVGDGLQDALDPKGK